uniref:Homeobox domain-containing protein n=1 Tax=Kalanchoe fedtschenkoi TaxID=63787 RepID=A0A7N0TAR6_KALFE
MCPAVGTSGAGCARAPRWCPTGEQVTLLEELYKGGLTNPTAGQIHQIVTHLSRFGKVQGKNVFYWFQNHKARDKQRARKTLAGSEKQTAELWMSRCSPNTHFICKNEMAFQRCNSSSSVSPFSNDEVNYDCTLN